MKKKGLGLFLFFISIIFFALGFKVSITGNVVGGGILNSIPFFQIIGFVFLIGSFLILTSKKLEGIVVPTGPSHEVGSQRASKGFEKYLENPDNLIFISGEFGQEKFMGSQPMKIYKQMRKAGVPRENFIFESKSRNTQENVLYLSDKIKEKGVNHITIVTDGPHAKRFKMLFDKAKNKGYAPKNLEVETFSEGIQNSYSPLKANLAYIKDYILPLNKKD